MVQKSGEKTTWDGAKTRRKQWDIYHINWCRISEPSTVAMENGPGLKMYIVPIENGDIPASYVSLL